VTVDTKRLLDRVDVLEIRGELPARIEALAYDSRKVAPGTCFVALRGTRTDGHRFLSAVESAGAAVAVVEEIPHDVNLPCVRVRDTLATMPLLAAEFFGNPARDMTLAGFTGTNGKTSSTYLLEAIWAAAGVPSAVIGTIQYRWKDRALKAPNTTPLALDLHELLHDIRRDGVRHVAMEVSSHALRLHRVDGLRFRAAAFTNLSPEHLDFHRDLEDYREAKAVLFESHLEAEGIGVINTDDAHGQILYGRLPADRRISFGLEPGVDITAEDIQLAPEETIFDLKTPSWSRRLRARHVGEHNLRNMLGAAGMGIALGLSEGAVVQGLEADTTVPGRLEAIENSRGARILVDFAHTPDGLFQVLNSLNALPHRRIITVFGCGGDRDRSKRPLMGGIAQRHSDLAILTSDNPRTENPMAIIDEVVAGMREGDGAFEIVPDRRAAIARALDLVGEGDFLLVAGKGHETMQILGTELHHFDDRAVVKEILAEIDGTASATTGAVPEERS
jgi:UDP-N-acetylmuramoyl-L-alanyl-D-glutamate--2,6-diaminopimelate ligase